MPRIDRRFIATDVLRIFEENLDLPNKRLVVAWFFSLIPRKEPKVDVIQVLLDIASLVPVVGTFSRLFSISLATAQAAKDIAELLGLLAEEEDIELAQCLLENELFKTEIGKLIEERREFFRTIDQQQERINALLATIELLEDELRQPPPIQPLPPALSNDILEADRIFQVIRNDLVANRPRIGTILFRSFRELPTLSVVMRRLRDAASRT